MSQVADSLSVADLMHACPHERPFNREGWIFESKLDGYRAFVRRSGGNVEMLTRRGNSLAATFPEIIRALARLPDQTVIDGELVVPDERQFPSFPQLRRRAVMKLSDSINDAAARHPAALCVFDCLVLRGRDIRAKPLLERKAAIAPYTEAIPCLQRVSHFEAEGVTAYAAAVAVGYERVVAKKADSPYRAGRQTTWLKIRNPRYERRELR